MTIQEAIKSEKLLRRKSWVECGKKRNQYFYLKDVLMGASIIPMPKFKKGVCHLFLSTHDILATDWEIKP